MYDEGCLSIPGLYVEMLRPKTVLVRGVDLDGEIIEIEADELEARMFQHEIDHLNGVLMFDRMTPDQRKEAMTEYRRLAGGGGQAGATHPASAGACASGMRRLVYLGTPDDGGAAAPGAGRGRPRRRAASSPGSTSGAGGGATCRRAR